MCLMALFTYGLVQSKIYRSFTRGLFRKSYMPIRIEKKIQYNATCCYCTFEFVLLLNFFEIPQWKNYAKPEIISELCSTSARRVSVFYVIINIIFLRSLVNNKSLVSRDPVWWHGHKQKKTQFISCNHVFLTRFYSLHNSPWILDISKRFATALIRFWTLFQLGIFWSSMSYM